MHTNFSLADLMCLNAYIFSQTTKFRILQNCNTSSSWTNLLCRSRVPFDNSGEFCPLLTVDLVVVAATTLTRVGQTIQMTMSTRPCCVPHRLWSLSPSPLDTIQQLAGVKDPPLGLRISQREENWGFSGQGGPMLLIPFTLRRFSAHTT